MFQFNKTIFNIVYLVGGIVMYKFKYFLCTFFVLFSFLFGKKLNNNSNLNVGIGLEFQFLTALLSEDGFQHIYVPITYKRFFLEPEIILYSRNISTDFKENNADNFDRISKGRGIAIGFYETKVKSETRVYYGAKLGHLKSSEMPYENLGLYELIEETSFLFAPTVGSEYFISENFSFGGEIAYQIVSKRREFDEDSSYLGNAYIERTRSQNIRPKFMVRFYFK